MIIDFQKFLTWLRLQPDDREFDEGPASCPLACYFRETEKVDAYVVSGILHTPDLHRVESPPAPGTPPVFLTPITIWKQQNLPKWAHVFEKLWDGPRLRDMYKPLAASRAQMLARAVGPGDAL